MSLPKCGNSGNHFTDYYYEENINNSNKKNNATIITKANIENNFCAPCGCNVILTALITKTVNTQ